MKIRLYTCLRMIGLLPPRQAAELLEVMGDKGVRLHTDVMEAVMQALDEQPLLL